jgi:hypothetical protein
MGLTDAANLLIAENATTTATDAAKTVSAYREFESYEFRSKTDPRPEHRYGTLAEAIEQLIDALGADELPEIFLNRGLPPKYEQAVAQGDIHIALSFRRPNQSAYLKLTPVPMAEEIAPMAMEEWVDSMNGVLFSFYPPKHRGPRRKKKNITADRTEETTIGYRTLRAVGKLLRQ